MTNRETAAAKARILFCAEDASLAHIGRVLALATALPDSAYDVAVACGTRYASFIDGAGVRRVAHEPALAPEELTGLLARGLPLFDAQRLQRCVRDDVALLMRERPDVVVGDFRPSLGISAELVGVPYVNVVNAYWSRACTLPLPCPELPLVRALGSTLAKPLVRVGAPIAFARHAAAFAALRRAYGLPAIGHSLRGMYTHGTFTLFPDLPELIPTRGLSPNQRYIGPIAWEPALPLPTWWNALPRRQESPLVYVTVGSTGDARMLDAIIHGLRDLDVTVVIATAGKTAAAVQDSRTFIAPFVPGIQMCERASLVVCNGGSGSVYQALGAGVPVIGIASNMDQYFAMEAVERVGAGALLRTGELSADTVRITVQRALDSSTMATRARALARSISRCDAAANFRTILQDDMLHPSARSSARSPSRIVDRSHEGMAQVTQP